MNEPARAAQPFRFYTRLHLSELTGLSASTFPRFLEILKNASDSCVYHHTHRFLQQHQHLSPEPPNDFAYWAAESMGDDELAEKLASIDTIRFSNLPALRDRIVAVVEEHLARTPNAALRRAAPGEEFYFIKAVSFVFPAPYVVTNLREFAEALRRVGIHSIYFHIFEARLRLAKKTNDFSHWLEDSLGEPELAKRIAALDPYTYTLEELRKKLVALVSRRIAEHDDTDHAAH